MSAYGRFIVNILSGHKRNFSRTGHSYGLRLVQLLQERCLFVFPFYLPT